MIAAHLRDEHMMILIKYATRGRPDLFKKTLSTYIGSLSGKHTVKIIVSIDRDDLSMNNPQMMKFIANFRNVFVKIGNSKSKIEAINANISSDEVFDILILASDDMIPYDNYDDLIVSDIGDNNMVALHYPDGLYNVDSSSIITWSVMSYALYKKLGYIYNPEYKSLWCDNDFTEVARNLGAYKFVDRQIVKHEWVGRTVKDELHYKNEALGSTDKKVFDKRKKEGFIVGGVQTLVRPKLSIMICTLSSRKNLFDRMMAELSRQKTSDVEILVESDNGELSTGAKRNKLRDRANGTYICSVDDDDMVAPTYIADVLDAIKSNPDAIGYIGEYYVDGVFDAVFKTGKDNVWGESMENGIKTYWRPHTHLSIVKREMSDGFSFPDKSWAEDKPYFDFIANNIKTEVLIDKVLYYYYYIPKKNIERVEKEKRGQTITVQAQQHQAQQPIKSQSSHRPNKPVQVSLAGSEKPKPILKGNVNLKNAFLNPVTARAAIDKKISLLKGMKKRS